MATILNPAIQAAIRQGWHDGDDWQVQYHETDDPRLLAVIRVDSEPESPDYDAQAPTVIGYEWGRRADTRTIGWSPQLFRGSANTVADAWLKARNEYEDEDLADRFVRIFHGVRAIHHLRSSVDQYSWAVVFDDPAWRDAMGIPRATVLDCDDVASEVQAYLDGDVYGVGYAVFAERTTHETPIEYDDFEETIECWGFYGDNYARETALRFDYGRPDLPPMLDGTEPGAAS